MLLQRKPQEAPIHSKGVLSYIQKEMHRLHTETTRSSDYLLKTVLLLYMLRPDAARVAGYVTTIIHSKGDAQAAHGDYA